MEVSVYDRMCWPAGELERALRLGSHRRELAAFLGHAEYALLRSLAGAASARHGRRASGPRVYILPGIMGSRLGMPRGPGQPMDLLWVDPADIVSGRLRELRWGAQPRLQSLGAIDYSYLPLKLRLQALGYDVSVHDYDWRQDLRLLGTALAARLRTDGGRPLALVGHSMGGLLARVALAELARDPAAARVIRVVCLGTPHGGSLAAVQALRASYPVVLRLAAIDGRYDARHLSRSVFASFMSLYQLLPHGSDRLDLFDAHAWPADGAGPRRALLATARGFAAALAPVDERFAGIVGTGQRTVTGIERRGGQFHYEISAAGDGTVPVRSAALPGARNYYLRCEHSELPRSERVARAIADLLRAGRTRRLERRWSTGGARRTQVSDARVRRSLAARIDWKGLGTAGRRGYFARLNAPPACYWPRPR